MGHAAAEAIVRAGLPLVPYTLTGYSAGVAVRGVGVAGIPVEVVGKQSRQEALDRVKALYGGGGGGGGGGGAAAAANGDGRKNGADGDGSGGGGGGGGGAPAAPAAYAPGRLVIVDYTTPAAALDNARFYARNGVPFVMGTTGADAALVAAAAEAGGVCAVVAPQMAKQVVALQAALRMAAESFPGAFAGYELDVVESHQASKVDVSGTAREVVRSLRALGGRFAAEGRLEAAAAAGASGGAGGAAPAPRVTDPAWHVRRVRDRATQQGPALGVPYDALGGHAYHTYTLSSPGAPPLPPLLPAGASGVGVRGVGGTGPTATTGAAQGEGDAAGASDAAADADADSGGDPDAGSWSRLAFKHNVVGRDAYAEGTADAVLFLAACARAAARGQGGGQRVFDMVDVLRAGDLRQRAADWAATREGTASSGGGGAAAATGAAATGAAAAPAGAGGAAAAGAPAAGRRASSASVAAAAAASAAATRTAKEQRAIAKAAEAADA